MVDNLIVPASGFDTTDAATWPADGLAAPFYGDFLKLFDTEACALRPLCLAIMRHGKIKSEAAAMRRPQMKNNQTG